MQAAAAEASTNSVTSVAVPQIESHPPEQPAAAHSPLEQRRPECESPFGHRRGSDTGSGNSGGVVSRVRAAVAHVTGRHLQHAYGRPHGAAVKYASVSPCGEAHSKAGENAASAANSAAMGL